MSINSRGNSVKHKCECGGFKRLPCVFSAMKGITPNAALMHAKRLDIVLKL